MFFVAIVSAASCDGPSPSYNINMQLSSRLGSLEVARGGGRTRTAASRAARVVVLLGTIMEITTRIDHDPNRRTGSLPGLC